jgi:hypothetical protein
MRAFPSQLRSGDTMVCLRGKVMSSEAVDDHSGTRVELCSLNSLADVLRRFIVVEGLYKGIK